MGIPSFYKHLLQTVGGLTSRTRTPPQLFALDLNCAIYHCSRKVKLPYSHDVKREWEDALIREVIGYIQKMVRHVAPTEMTYIAVDGVAPMAKIKQQRTRRFKSALTAAEESALRSTITGKPVGDRWDTNAITPGTAFMERLAVALRALSGSKYVVSPADEAGEGEQKIMEFLRSRPTIQNAVVYGLDADLIILALLDHGLRGRTLDLFREETEFGGGVKTDALGDEQFLYLTIPHLASALYDAWHKPGQERKEFLMDFVAAMNLLGNDFVPHGMSLKINDGGIEHVLATLKTLKSPLVVNGAYNTETMIQLFEMLKQNEEGWMLRGIRRKLDARVGATAAKDPEAIALARLNDRPVEWAAEKCMVELRATEGYEKPRWEFKPSWRETYRKEALWGSDITDVVRDYCKTLAWTLDYYLGMPVDPSWYYAWPLPPLLADVEHALRMTPNLLASWRQTGEFLQPVEQLAIVLPRTSYSLLPPAFQTLPDRFPWAWPVQWASFSLGRRFLWECEPLIPLIRPDQIREWIK
jgi:5'-3' exoribonuclease 1